MDNIFNFVLDKKLPTLIDTYMHTYTPKILNYGWWQYLSILFTKYTKWK